MDLVGDIKMEKKEEKMKQNREKKKEKKMRKKIQKWDLYYSGSFLVILSGSI